MTFATAKPSGIKAEIYRELLLQARGLFEGERDAIANAANLASLIYHGLDDLNWAGFYFLKGDELVLGPFQGKPACIRIGMGKGVCGSAAAKREIIIVADVDKFPGHIPCDSASRSEIVIPLIQSDRLLGVLDLDSPNLDRFGRGDATGLEALAALWLEKSETPTP
jgi:GAF domain-containing protein